MAIDQSNWRKHLKNVHWLRFKFWFGDMRYAIARIYRRVCYQWFSPYQLLTIRSIKATDYRDIDTLLVESVFQLLVNYVEIEKAQLGKITMLHHYQEYKKGQIPLDDLNAQYDLHKLVVGYAGMSLWERWCVRKTIGEAFGLLYLTWEESLRNDPSQYPEEKECLIRQADTATEVKTIYKYIKYERPNRPDPWMSAFPEPELRYENEDGTTTSEEICPPERDPQTGEIFFRMRKMTAAYAEYLEKCSKLEQEYYEKDTEMAQRILKIRQSLWT